MTDREHDALLLCRDALRLAGAHLRLHGGYSVRVSTIIEAAEREADKALADAKVPA